LPEGVAKMPGGLDFKTEVMAENFFLRGALLNEALANRGSWFEIHL
jgi:hypothetical protein